MNIVSAYECGYGHVIMDYEQGQMIFTSQQAMGTLMNTTFKILSAMARDISELTGLPEALVINDYVNDCGCNIINESFEAALKRKCKKEGRPYMEPDSSLTSQCLTNIKKNIYETRATKP